MGFIIGREKNQQRIGNNNKRRKVSGEITKKIEMDITYHNLWQRIALAILGILGNPFIWSRPNRTFLLCGSGNQSDLLNSVVFFFFFFRLLTTTSKSEQGVGYFNMAHRWMRLMIRCLWFRPIQFQSNHDGVDIHRSRESITKHATSTHIIRPVDRLHWIHILPQHCCAVLLPRLSNSLALI